MSKSKISILGLNSYLKAHDDDLFALLTLPEDVDKDTVIDTILLKSAPFEVLYSDPEFLKLSIGVWSKKYFNTFDKWVKALALEFNPIENYDRIEEWDDTGNNSGNSRNGSNNQVEGKKSAFDSIDYQNSDLTINSSSANTEFSNDNKNHHTGRVHGNIGVTTSSALLSEYLQIAEWNIYEHIADLFINEFCLLIY